MAKLGVSIPKITLPDGNEIPILGYGVGSAWCKNTTKKAMPEGPFNDQLVEATKTAISLGFHHLDSAEIYGTECDLAKAIKDSGVPRESLFITAKCYTMTRDVIQSLEQSLKNLGLEYVDLYLLHQAFDIKGDKAIIQKAWSQMESIQASGKAKSIGVSNFYRAELDAILEVARARPAINQIEFHPYLDNDEFLAFQKNKDIRIAAYGPLVPFVKVKDGPLTPLLEQLAKKYAVGPTEILLRWLLDQNIVAITTTSQEQRMSDMLRVTTFKLTPKELSTITETGKQYHFRGYWENDLN